MTARKPRPQWEADWALLERVYWGTVHLALLTCREDKVWLIRSLQDKGEGEELIAQRLHTSTRAIRRVLATHRRMVDA